MNFLAITFTKVIQWTPGLVKQKLILSVSSWKKLAAQIFLKCGSVDHKLK